MKTALLVLLPFANLLAAPAAAKNASLQIPTSIGQLSLPMQIALFLTALSLLPAIFVSVTPFLRITLVLHFLRQALGTQTVPSNQVLLCLSMFLTIILMQPVAADIYNSGYVPFDKGQMSATDAFEAGSKPFKTFLVKFAHEKDIQLFLEIAKEQPPQKPDQLSLKVLMPAYVLSELKAGFQIGAVLFLPFLVIDIVIASVTLSVGMVQLPPVMIAAPFKLLLFVLVDGWALVIGSLMKSFA